MATSDIICGSIKKKISIIFDIFHIVVEAHVTDSILDHPHTNKCGAVPVDSVLSNM